jgi:hypothetical protein
VSRAAPKPRIALTVSGGRCNVGMPNNVFDRFLWVIKLYAQAGFKVVIDNHVWLEDPTGASLLGGYAGEGVYVWACGSSSCTHRRASRWSSTTTSGWKTPQVRVGAAVACAYDDMSAAAMLPAPVTVRVHMAVALGTGGNTGCFQFACTHIIP